MILDCLFLHRMSEKQLLLPGRGTTLPGLHRLLPTVSWNIKAIAMFRETHLTGELCPWLTGSSKVQSHLLPRIQVG